MVTVKLLKNELRELGLPTTGLKKDLVNRLEEYKKYDIWELCRSGDLQKIQKIVKAEAKVGKFDINRLSVFDRTPLHMASLCGHIYVIEYLIKLGAYDYNGNAYLSGTPLARNVLKQYGFKGVSFTENPEVKILNSERALCLMNLDLDYDLIITIHKLVKRYFKDSISNYLILKRFLNEK
jgi:hypothetical protein